MQVGHCYLVTGGTIKQANPQYNNTSHSCEITLGRQTTIEDSEVRSYTPLGCYSPLGCYTPSGCYTPLGCYTP